MNKILVIGASGQVGKLVIQQLRDRGTGVRAMVRDTSRLSEINMDGIEVVEANLEGDFADVFDGCRTVIFSAGSGANTGPDKTLLVDLWGARNAMEHALENGVEHFIMVSSRNAGDPDHGPAAIKPYLIAKYFADEYLIESGLTFTILRPGRLLNQPATGLLTTKRPQDPAQQVITRADTAAAIVHAIGNEDCLNDVFELYQGDIPVDNIYQTFKLA